MGYGDFKDLARRTASDKAFNIAKNPKNVGYQRGLVFVVYNFFDKKALLIVVVLKLKMKLSKMNN